MKLLTTGFFFLFVLVLSAQNSGTNFGLKAGLNVADVSNERLLGQELDLTSNTYYHVGFFAVFPFGNKWGLQPELQYSVKGTRSSIIFNAPLDSEYRLKLHYLTLPVLLNYNLGNLTIQGGPEFAYRMRTDVKATQAINVDIAETIWNTDLDLGLALGFNYKLNQMNIGIRYVYGLIGVAEEIAFTEPNGRELFRKDGLYKNRVLQLSLGLTIL